MKTALNVKVKCRQLPTTSSVHHGHTHTKLHQFLNSSFRDFVWTDLKTDAAKNNTCSQQVSR